MPDRIDPTSDRPVFRQLADLLREDVRSGRLVPGDRLPSETELMNRFRAARGTVRQAIAVLRTEGLIQVEHGRGAFVRLRQPVRRLAHDRFARRHRDAGKAAFHAETETAGHTPSVEVIDVRKDRCPNDVAVLLKLRRGTAVLVRERRYFVDDEPVELATSYIPWNLASGTPMAEQYTGPGGIYARLEELGHRLAKFTEEVRSRSPLPEERRSLRLADGVPVFELRRTACDVEGRAVEVCDTVLAADRFVLTYELPAT
ncbi:MAG: GntR family transcriptional regulator [Actinomycetes bacterium]